MISRFVNKRNFQKKLIEWFADLIAKTGVNPNYVTLFSVFLALAAGYFIFQSNLAIGFVFLFFSAAVDLIDGCVARLAKKVTKFGNYFDAMTDKYVEVILYISFALSGWPIEAIFALAGSMLISYAKPRVAIVIKIDNHDWPAIGERGDRLMILIIGVFLAIFVPAIYGFSVVSITLILIAIVTNIGAVQRIFYARKLINKSEVL